MQNALIIGDTGGIGAAVSIALKAKGWHVEGLSRSRDGFDITDQMSVDKALGAVEGPFDFVFVATGGLVTDMGGPEKSLGQINADAMEVQFRLNCVGPALVLRHMPRLLRRDGEAVCAVLSARLGSIGDNRLGGWYSYRVAKAAVNQMVHSASIELRRSHPDSICISLHPGTVQTNLTKGFVGQHHSVSAQEAAANILRVVEGLTPMDTGRFFDWRGKEVPW